MVNLQKRFEFARKGVETLVLWTVSGGLLYVTVWSFLQTYRFTSRGNDVQATFFLNDIAFWYAAIFQYGQNLFLFLAFRAGNKTIEITNVIKIRWRDLCYFGWAFCAFVDAGTNVGEWRAENPEVATNMNIISITWYAICIGAIFVEETFGLALAAAMEATSDVLKMWGFGVDENSKQKTDPNIPFYPGRTSSPVDFGGGKNKGQRFPPALDIERNEGLKVKGKKGQWKPGSPGRPPKEYANMSENDKSRKRAELMKQIIEESETTVKK